MLGLYKSNCRSGSLHRCTSQHYRVSRSFGLTKLYLVLLFCSHILLSKVSGDTSTNNNNNNNNNDNNDITDDEDEEEPLHVYILSGQSNMVGYGEMDHMDLLVQDSYNDTEYRQMLWYEESNTYRSRSDVYVKFDTAHGPLTLGRTTGYAGGSSFGPELMFGWTICDHYNSRIARSERRNNKVYKHQIRDVIVTAKQRKLRKDNKQQQRNQQKSNRPNILVLKVAWGGKNLAIDYRPPRSGEGSYPNVKPSYYGYEYRHLISDTTLALQQLDQFVPSYNGNSSSYVVKGFVWFQGWNDMLDTNMVHEYEYNLANFIRDVRLDLDLPGLPFVIGELGMHGLNITGHPEEARVLGIRAAQRNVCLLDEFINTTIFVPTAQHAVLDGATYNGIYHYNGRADTYYHIGQDFGTAMIQLLEQQQQQQQHQQQQQQQQQQKQQLQQQQQQQQQQQGEIRSHTVKKQRITNK